MIKKIFTTRNIFNLLTISLLIAVNIYSFFTSPTNVNEIIKLKEDVSSIQKSDKKTYIALIDTGFDVKHPAYSSKVSKKYRYSSDGSGDIREIPRYNKGYYQLSHHGTHIAGIVSGELNYSGFLSSNSPSSNSSSETPSNINRSHRDKLLQGIYPNGTLIFAQILPYASEDEVVQTFNYIKETPAQIVSMSMSLGSKNNPISYKIARSILDMLSTGKVLVISAGNEGSELLDTPYGYTLSRLAQVANSRYTGRMIIVGSSGFSKPNNIFTKFIYKFMPFLFKGDYMSYFSNKGTGLQNFFITAPGENILSSATNMFSNTQLMSGTSMSAPIVAGSIARILEKTQNIDTSVDLLLRNARQYNLLTGEPLEGSFGAGIVDLSFLENF